jgi:hypothetical protein
MFTAPYTRHIIFDPANIYSLYIHYSIFSLIALNDINAYIYISTISKNKNKNSPFYSFSASYIGRVIYHNLYPLIIANFLKKKKKKKKKKKISGLKRAYLQIISQNITKKKKGGIPFRAIKLKASSSNMMRFK